jgi:DNA-binding NarL/FixJ family response regulator
MRYGAAGYLTKDLGPDALRRSIRGVLAGDLPMSRNMAARLVRRLMTASAGVDEGLNSLSDREREVLGLIAEGMTNRQIANRLVVSPRTAEAHVRKILHKLGVRNRTEAARYLAAPAAGSPGAADSTLGYGARR